MPDLNGLCSVNVGGIITEIINNDNRKPGSYSRDISKAQDRDLLNCSSSERGGQHVTVFPYLLTDGKLKSEEMGEGIKL